MDLVRMDIGLELENARAEEERLQDLMDRTRVDLRAVQARIKELALLAGRNERPEESLTDAVVRVVVSAGHPLGVSQVLERLVAEGRAGVNEGSVRANLSRHVKHGGQLVSPRRGVYEAA